MWTMISLLWLIPLMLGAVVIVRIAVGTRPIKREEWRLFFGKSRQTSLSLWMWLKFAALAIGFFIVGLAEAVILPNFSTFWFLVAPLLTAGTTILLLVIWLRSGSTPYQIRHHNTRGNRIADMFFR